MRKHNEVRFIPLTKSFNNETYLTSLYRMKGNYLYRKRLTTLELRNSIDI